MQGDTGKGGIKMMKGIERILEILDYVKKENPYPADIFTGKTEEGMRGVAARISWDVCCEKIKKEVLEYAEK